MQFRRYRLLRRFEHWKNFRYKSWNCVRYFRRYWQIWRYWAGDIGPPLNQVIFKMVSSLKSIINNACFLSKILFQNNHRIITNTVKFPLVIFRIIIHLILTQKYTLKTYFKPTWHALARRNRVCLFISTSQCNFMVTPFNRNLRPLTRVSTVPIYRHDHT